LGVVSGIVMAFEFGTNWSVLSKMSGPIQGPLLTYETFTAFMLEATFFGVLVFGRSRVHPWFYLFSTTMVALGTTFSAFWTMVNNSWMQAPVAYVMENGAFVPDDWTKIIFSPVRSASPPRALGTCCGANVKARLKSCSEWGCSSPRRWRRSRSFLASHRRLRPRLSTREVCGDRGALA
jgi:hypothetical protein